MSDHYGDDIAQTAAQSTRNRLKNRFLEHGEPLSAEDALDMLEEDEHEPPLGDGGPPLTWADVQEMDEAAISANWQEVSKVLQRGPDAPPPEPDTSGPLTAESVRAMSPEEAITRRAEIDAWLASGGASQ